MPLLLLLVALFIPAALGLLFCCRRMRQQRERGFFTHRRKAPTAVIAEEAKAVPRVGGGDQSGVTGPQTASFPNELSMAVPVEDTEPVIRKVAMEGADADAAAAMRAVWRSFLRKPCRAEERGELVERRKGKVECSVADLDACGGQRNNGINGSGQVERGEGLAKAGHVHAMLGVEDLAGRRGRRGLWLDGMEKGAANLRLHIGRFGCMARYALLQLVGLE